MHAGLVMDRKTGLYQDSNHNTKLQTLSAKTNSSSIKQIATASNKQTAAASNKQTASNKQKLYLDSQYHTKQQTKHHWQNQTNNIISLYLYTLRT